MRWKLSAKKDHGKGAVGQRNPKDDKRKTEPEQPGGAEHGYRANVAITACLGVMLLLIQIGLIFGVLPAGAIDIEPSKGDWWPTKQYSWTDVILAFTTLALLLATTAYAIVSFRQWAVLRETLDETRRANSLSLRAWVLVEKIEVVRRLSEVEPGNFLDRPVSVTVRNYGKVPAVDVTQFDEITPPNGGWPKGAPKVTGSTHRVIAAGAAHTFRLTFHRLTAEELASADQEVGGGVLFLAVRFTYTDALGTKGDSSYCWFYSHRTEDGSPFMADFPGPEFSVS